MSNKSGEAKVIDVIGHELYCAKVLKKNHTLDCDCGAEERAKKVEAFQIHGNEERIAGALTEIVVGFFKTPKTTRVQYVRELLEKALEKK